tara:strand:- start:993 stop:1580 length:588 start_codon:yes stop_codon:yes gene_type:complete
MANNREGIMNTERLPYDNYDLERWSYEDILKMNSLEELDLNPAFQREEVAPVSWKRKFITTWIRGGVHSVLTFRQLKDGRKQSIDGLQRVTTGIGFTKSKFKTLPANDIVIDGHLIDCPSILYKDLHKDKNGDSLKEKFLAQKFIVVMYDESMTDEQAAETFQKINFANALNDQEYRQARTHALAKYVRSNARGI